MKKFLIGLGVVFLVLIVVFVIFGGFAAFKANRMMPSVESFVNSFYEQYNDQKYGYIYNQMADAKYKGVATLDAHEKFLKGVFSKMGKVERKEKGAWRINYAPDGVYFAVQYKAFHKTGQSDDSFLLKKNGDFWSLAGYYVNSLDLV